MRTEKMIVKVIHYGQGKKLVHRRNIFFETDEDGIERKKGQSPLVCQEIKRGEEIPNDVNSFINE